MSSEGFGDFASYLTRIMQLRGWSTAEAARQLEVSDSTVRKWRTGLRIPNTWYARRIAETFGLDEREVLVRTGHLDPIRLEEDPVRTELHDLIDSIPVDSLRPYVAVFQQLAPPRQSGTE